MATALYDVKIAREGKPTRFMACVRAVPQSGPNGNWFAAIGDFMTPDAQAIRAALPYNLRKAWDRRGVPMWHLATMNDAHVTLFSARNEKLATIRCSGYVRD